ncbi:MAG: hypothetical protein ACQEWM_04360 [Actinomycetota bacterium]
MPRHPIAWLLAIAGYLLLASVLGVGIVAATGALGGGWVVWGPLIAICASWLVCLIGGFGTYSLLRVGAFLSVLYLIGFVVLGISAVLQTRWEYLWIALPGAVITPFVGGFLLHVMEAIQRGIVERQLAAAPPEMWAAAIDDVRRREGI